MKGFISILAVFVFAGAFLFPACAEKGSYRLHLLFPDEDAVDATVGIELWVLDATQASCQELVDGLRDPDSLVVSTNLELDFPFGSDAPVLGSVPAGGMLFLAAARDSAGQEFLRGCRAEQVRGGIELTVTIEFQPICVPNPDGEQPDNLLDDDCDGLTDECTSPQGCDDGNACTADLCVDQACQQVNLEEARCNPEDPCLSDGVCRNGTCQAEPKECSAWDGVCTRGVCEETTGECIEENLPDDTGCQDGLYCSDGDTCQQGICQGQPLDCDDGDGCTLDSCNEVTDECEHVVQYIPGAEGPPGDPNCSNDVDDDCDLLTDSEDPSCVECQDNLDCEDFNVCTVDACIDLTCSNQAVADGSECDDGLFCSEEQACQAGICQNTLERDCSNLSDGCNLGVCIEAVQGCVAQPLADGTGCDDGLYCTVGDACESGDCITSARDCADTDFCTDDQCNEDTNVCDHILVPNPGAEGPVGDQNCANQTDDDCDGLTDMEDNDCRSCTWMGTFGPVVPEPGLDTFVGDAWAPNLTADLLLIAFQIYNDGPPHDEIFYADRPDAFVNFSTPQPLTEVNTDDSESMPIFSEDGLELYIWRNATGSGDIWRSTRPDRDSAFSEPVLVTELNTGSTDAPNWLSPDKLRLYIHSTRTGSMNRDFWMAERPSTEDPFGPAVNLQSINSDASDIKITLSRNELEAFFASNRANGLGMYDIWYAVRPDTESDFSQPQNVAALNSDLDDVDPHLTPDGTTIYFNHHTCIAGGCSFGALVYRVTRVCD